MVRARQFHLKASCEVNDSSILNGTGNCYVHPEPAKAQGFPPAATPKSETTGYLSLISAAGVSQTIETF
jgi:hypothetical protein